ncbi:Sjogren's syndrome/scleroderma autoantigen 1 family protein [Halogeometricum limi]|uniref:Uncharacterized Zn-finger containing protein, UPF0148 family n=1 Tax=Halogeometricum limi TaxID=555875 RepID=A0A1I6FQS5_9EURY|nr:Sjogren's syndrome/scleroderma autoantigen 1 family protein [Halogeometricum limi]SFR32302.1 Uncharacterized Zn-finger containing protein, UPF0148 family [Halogeometricum limi]
MSDFDKEAERQRLREKYEKDEERRKETQRMSELLLQGATMTNKHCNDCGTPIFRYQGTEFCPNCQSKQAEVAAEAADDAAAGVVEGTPASNGAASTASAGAEPNRDAEETAASTADAVGESRVEADAESSPTPSTSAMQSGSETRAESTSPEPPVQSGSAARQPPKTASGRAVGTGTAPAETGSPDASVQAARESLLQAIIEHARRSTAADEPRRAKEHLEAAHEAADALAALDR